MDTTSLIVAVLGVVLGALSLGWQAATHVLTGGRAKAQLRLGALAISGLYTIKPTDLSGNSLADLVAQTGGRPVIAVRVANVGRLPVTVSQWGISSTRGVTFHPLAQSIGPELPHRLEAGNSETWAADLSLAVDLARTTYKVLGRKRPASLLSAIVAAIRHGRNHGIVCVVELADDRKVRTRGQLTERQLGLGDPH